MIFFYFFVIVGKKGICFVFFIIILLCVVDVYECFMDYDCVKDMKCCFNGCYRVCVFFVDDNDIFFVVVVGNVWKNYFKGFVLL